MRIERFETEIVPKGKAYLVVRDGQGDRLEDTYREMREKGARQVFAAFLQPERELRFRPCGGVELVHAHDMLGLTLRLTADRPRPEGRLTLEPLEREDGAQFLQIYNESFYCVPNSETYDETTLEALMGPCYHCGFALLDGARVGIYELGFKKEKPEIGSIGLTSEARGKGLGRELLLTVMDHLEGLGCRACWLQVSTLNRAAYPLYRSVGFGEDELLGRWFEVTQRDG